MYTIRVFYMDGKIEEFKGYDLVIENGVVRITNRKTDDVTYIPIANIRKVKCTR